MALQNSHANLRWTTEIPKEATNPKGPADCFKRAIERLGPFKHRLQADADRLGPWVALHGRMAVSEGRCIRAGRTFGNHIQSANSARPRRPTNARGRQRHRTCIDPVSRTDAILRLIV